MTYITSIERMGIEKGVKQGFKQGFKKGFKKGLRKGIKKGEALACGRLLTKRFGALPSWAEERLKKAGRQQLELYLERVQDAKRLRDVFKDT